MDERHAGEQTGGSDGSTRATPATTPTNPPRRSRLGLKLVGIFVLLPALLIAAWVFVALRWSYSNGDRAGYIQKFSQKGWLCKTWEGDIAMSTIPGSMPEHFLFTVHSDSVAHEISNLMGSRVSLHYQEHRGVPGSCFGDTRYFVTGVKSVAGP